MVLGLDLQWEVRGRRPARDEADSFSSQAPSGSGADYCRLILDRAEGSEGRYHLRRQDLYAPRLLPLFDLEAAFIGGFRFYVE